LVSSNKITLLPTTDNQQLTVKILLSANVGLVLQTTDTTCRPRDIK